MDKRKIQGLIATLRANRFLESVTITNKDETVTIKAFAEGKDKAVSVSAPVSSEVPALPNMDLVTNGKPPSVLQELWNNIESKYKED